MAAPRNKLQITIRRPAFASSSQDFDNASTTPFNNAKNNLIIEGSPSALLSKSQFNASTDNLNNFKSEIQPHQPQYYTSPPQEQQETPSSHRQQHRIGLKRPPSAQQMSKQATVPKKQLQLQYLPYTQLTESTFQAKLLSSRRSSENGPIWKSSSYTPSSSGRSSQASSRPSSAASSARSRQECHRPTSARSTNSDLTTQRSAYAATPSASSTSDATYRYTPSSSSNSSSNPGSGSRIIPRVRPSSAPLRRSTKPEPLFQHEQQQHEFILAAIMRYQQRESRISPFHPISRLSDTTQRPFSRKRCDNSGEDSNSLSVAESLKFPKSSANLKWSLSTGRSEKAGGHFSSLYDSFSGGNRQGRKRPSSAPPSRRGYAPSVVSSESSSSTGFLSARRYDSRTPSTSNMSGDDEHHQRQQHQQHQCDDGSTRYSNFDISSITSGSASVSRRGSSVQGVRPRSACSHRESQSRAHRLFLQACGYIESDFEDDDNGNSSIRYYRSTSPVLGRRVSTPDLSRQLSRSEASMVATASLRQKPPSEYVDLMYNSDPLPFRPGRGAGLIAYDKQISRAQREFAMNPASLYNIRSRNQTALNIKAYNEFVDTRIPAPVNMDTQLPRSYYEPKRLPKGQQKLYSINRKWVDRRPQTVISFSKQLSRKDLERMEASARKHEFNNGQMVSPKAFEALSRSTSRVNISRKAYVPDFKRSTPRHKGFGYFQPNNESQGDRTVDHLNPRYSVIERRTITPVEFKFQYNPRENNSNVKAAPSKHKQTPTSILGRLAASMPMNKGKTSTNNVAKPSPATASATKESSEKSISPSITSKRTPSPVIMSKQTSRDRAPATRHYVGKSHEARALYKTNTAFIAMPTKAATPYHHHTSTSRNQSATSK